MKLFQLVAALLFTYNVSAQMVHDFTVTDTDGQVHNIYTDHLDQGQTVVLKLFFVACPPCNSIAPSVQTLYEQWGEGEGDVEFIEITTINGDDDSEVNGYKTMHGLTFPGVSAQGNASQAVGPIKSGTYGPYFGTPSFAVISPDGTINYGVPFNGLSEAIAATGATGGGQTAPEPTTYRITFAHPQNGMIPNDHLKVKLAAEGTTSPSYNIGIATGGTFIFDYPSENIPLLTNPTLYITSSAPANTGGISAFDIVKIRKHILNFEPFTEDWQVRAADVTGEGSVSGFDVVNLRKVILNLQDEFPNGLPGQIILNSEIPLLEAAGTTLDVEVLVIKRGDVN